MTNYFLQVITVFLLFIALFLNKGLSEDLCKKLCAPNFSGTDRFDVRTTRSRRFVRYRHSHVTVRYCSILGVKPEEVTGNVLMTFCDDRAAMSSRGNVVMAAVEAV